MRDDVVREKAAELAKQRAAAIAAELKGAKDFAAAAKKAGLEVKTTELIARGAAIPDLGVSDDVDAAAFALPQGGVSDPITTPHGHRHRPRRREGRRDRRSRSPPARIRCATSWSNQRRDKFFSAYMQKAKTELKINIKQDTLAQVVGANSPATPGLPPLQ